MSPSLCFNSPAPTEISTLSLHDALPIFHGNGVRVLTWLEGRSEETHARAARAWVSSLRPSDRKSTRLNSSHVRISYAVFCLKKKKTTTPTPHTLPTSTTEPPQPSLARLV